MQVEPAVLDRMLFQSEGIRVASFHCPVGHPLFHDSGPLANYTVYFPRTAVWIRHREGRPFVADPGWVTVYNRGQEYGREAVSPAGDHGEWIGVDEGLAEEITRTVLPDVGPQGDRVFQASHGPSSAEAWLRVRSLTRGLKRGDLEPLEIEEEALQLFSAAILGAHRFWGRHRGAESRRKQRSLAQDAKAFLAARPAEPLNLGTIAAALAVSPFHLSHTFRREIGSTLSAYRTDLRLRMSVEALESSQVDLATLALELGFSSHSHFSTAFRRVFSISPWEFRGSRRRQRKAMKARPSGDP